MKRTTNNTSREQIIALRQRDASAGLRADYWSSDDRDTLQKMFDDGAGITEMALFFHRSETAIVAQLNTLGMFERSRASRQKESDCLCPNCKFYPKCDKCRERMKIRQNNNS